MSITLDAKMYTDLEAFEYGKGLQEANGGGRIRMRLVNDEWRIKII